MDSIEMQSMINVRYLVKKEIIYDKLSKNWIKFDCVLFFINGVSLLSRSATINGTDDVLIWLGLFSNGIFFIISLSE